MAFSFDSSYLTSVYQERIDYAINNLGKDIVLYIARDPVETEPTEEEFDPVRGQQIKHKNFKPSAFQKQYDIVTIKALVNNDPKDFQRFNIQISNSANVVRLKTFMQHLPNLQKCEYILLPNSELSYSKFKLIREPMKHGFKEERYCISYWERVP